MRYTKKYIHKVFTWLRNFEFNFKPLVNCERDDFNPIMINTRTLKYKTNREKFETWQGFA